MPFIADVIVKNENSKLQELIASIQTYYDDKTIVIKDKTISWAIRSVLKLYLEKITDTLLEYSFEIVSSISLTSAYFINTKYGISYRYSNPVFIIIIKLLFYIYIYIYI